MDAAVIESRTKNNLLGLMFLEILSHLISVAADGHAAPLPRMILRIVIEGVATGSAL